MGSKLRYGLTLFVIAASFGLWGMGYALTEPMSYAVAHVLDMKDDAAANAMMTRAMHVAYILLAIPAMLFIRRYGFKSGLFVGLMCFAGGALSFLTASQVAAFEPYVICYATLAIGVLLLELTANPYAMTYGKRRHSLFRLSVAQTFNVVGWLGGLTFVGPFLRVCEIDVQRTPVIAERLTLEAAQRDDLLMLAMPCAIAGVAAVILAAITGVVDFYDRPDDKEPADTGIKAITERLLGSKAYLLGVATLFIYVMAQALCWSNIMHYGTDTLIGSAPGSMSRADANDLSYKFQIAGIASFGVGRLILAIASYKAIKRPAIVLAVCAIAACALTLVALIVENFIGLGCLVAASGCMSVMYPIIYYVSTRQLDVSATQVGTVGHVYAIFGSLAAAYVAYDSDGGASIRMAVAAVLFGIVAAYGIWSNKHRLH